MAFALTKFIYPLESPIRFFDVPLYEFDNARTKEEINLVKEFISKTLEFENERYKKDNSEQSFRVLFGIGELKDYLRKIDPNDFALKYYEQNIEKKLIDILSETFVIVRFKDNGDFDGIVKDKSQLIFKMIYRVESSYTENFKQLVKICQLISLLANEDNRYHGETFLLTRNPYDIFYSIARYEVDDALEEFKSFNFLLKSNNRGKSWTYWLDGKDKVFNAGIELFSLFKQSAYQPKKGEKLQPSQKQTPAQKLLHIGSNLRMASSHISDPELVLILLVGILEYLVTRNPDQGKFNVEDSISKQFKLKCSLLIHSQNKKIEIEEISKSLAKIYNQRSDIAHGNYVANYSVDELVDSGLTLFRFIKIIISIYISDRKMVEYLKDN